MELTFLDLVKIILVTFVGASLGVITGNIFFRVMSYWKTKLQIRRFVRRELKKDPWLFDVSQQKK